MAIIFSISRYCEVTVEWRGWVALSTFSWNFDTLLFRLLDDFLNSLLDGAAFRVENRQEFGLPALATFVCNDVIDNLLIQCQHLKVVPRSRCLYAASL